MNMPENEKEYWNRIGSYNIRITKLIGLGTRLSLCEKSLINYDDPPSELNAFTASLENLTKVTTLMEKQNNKDYDPDKIFKEVGINHEVELIDALDYILNCDIREEESLSELGIWCFLLAHFYCEFIEKIQNNKDGQYDEEFTVFCSLDREISEKSYEAIGYWSAKAEPKISAARNQGAMSKEIGELSIKEAEKILDKIGGIEGYIGLVHGQKKYFRDEIEKKLHLKDGRHVYNILKSIKNKSQR